MKAHNGIRPQDIPVLLKIWSIKDKELLNKDLATELFISPAEISESLSRSVYAGLLNPNKRSVHKTALFGLIVHGLKYIFPTKAGTMGLGMSTAGYAPILKGYSLSELALVWPDQKEGVRGLIVSPLYPGAVQAAKLDPVLYDLLALCDVFRIGSEKEIKIAQALLNNIFSQGDDYISC